MKIEFLGSGSAFVLADENYQSNILLTEEVDGVKKTFLFDAGTTIAESLNKAGYTPQDINNIFISHLHADHAGGVEYLGFKNFFSTFPFGESRPNLISHKTILESGWDNTWKGGMKSIEGQMTTLETFFETVYLEDNAEIDFEGNIIKITQTTHITDDRKIVPSYGLQIIRNNGDVVFITGDCKFNPHPMMKYYNQSDVIFQDCELAEYPGSVHAQYHQLKTLPEDIKGKMWLYHYSVNGIELPDAVADGFKGFVERGDVF